MSRIITGFFSRRKVVSCEHFRMKKRLRNSHRRKYFRRMTIKTISTIAIAEGISYITFAITMPLKYGLDILWPNKIVGWAHGVLFILYLYAMWVGSRKYGWSMRNTLIALAASLIPFLPFWVEKRIIRNEV